MSLTAVLVSKMSLNFLSLLFFVRGPNIMLVGASQASIDTQLSSNNQPPGRKLLHLPATTFMGRAALLTLTGKTCTKWSKSVKFMSSLKNISKVVNMLTSLVLLGAISDI